jgi:hypothetical protein
MPSIEIFDARDALIYSGYEGLVYEKIDDKTYRRITDYNYIDVDKFQIIKDVWSSYIGNRTLTIIERKKIIGDLKDINQLKWYINELLEKRQKDPEYANTCDAWFIMKKLIENISKLYSRYTIVINDNCYRLLYSESRAGFEHPKSIFLANPDIKNHHKGIIHCEFADYEDGYFVFFM